MGNYLFLIFLKKTDNSSKLSVLLKNRKNKRMKFITSEKGLKCYALKNYATTINFMKHTQD